MPRLLNLRGNRRSVLTLLDQILVSGVNFASTTLFVRGLGLTRFGKFAIAYAILLFANSLLLGLVAAPMFSTAPQLEHGKERNQYLQGIFTLQFLLASILSLLTSCPVTEPPND
jgi:O-antigen/teichoic acid export membrane protein